MVHTTCQANSNETPFGKRHICEPFVSCQCDIEHMLGSSAFYLFRPVWLLCGPENGTIHFRLYIQLVTVLRPVPSSCCWHNTHVALSCLYFFLSIFLPLTHSAQIPHEPCLLLKDIGLLQHQLQGRQYFLSFGVHKSRTYKNMFILLLSCLWRKLKQEERRVKFSDRRHEVVFPFLLKILHPISLGSILVTRLWWVWKPRAL